jgi:hypothetical protein
MDQLQQSPLDIAFSSFPLTRSRFDTFDGAKPRFLNRGKKRRFLRQAQDTEFIEVQY